MSDSPAHAPAGHATNWPAELERHVAESAGEPVATTAVVRPQKFDPAIAWRLLSPHEQRRVGIAGLTLAYARAAALHTDDRAGIGFEAAEHHAGEALSEALGQLVFPDGRTPPLPDLAPLGIRACRCRGCTDECGCTEGCAWAADDPAGDLCTSCAPVPTARSR